MATENNTTILIIDDTREHLAFADAPPTPGREAKDCAADRENTAMNSHPIAQCRG